MSNCVSFCDGINHWWSWPTCTSSLVVIKWSSNPVTSLFTSWNTSIKQTLFISCLVIWDLHRKGKINVGFFPFCIRSQNSKLVRWVYSLRQWKNVTTDCVCLFAKNYSYKLFMTVSSLVFLKNMPVQMENSASFARQWAPRVMWPFSSSKHFRGNYFSHLPNSRCY